MMDLTGRTVAITGASSGIGEATAVACARAGAAVALAARRSERVAEVAARIEADGGRAVALPADVADQQQAEAFVGEARDRLGGLDALVNNAGVMHVGPILGAPIDEWRRMIDVNVLGLLYCTRSALPGMVEQGFGDIVNVGSVAGRSARAGNGVYNLTKFGVTAFSEALRQEVTQSGVRVTVVQPGATVTELVDHSREEFRQELSAAFEGCRPIPPSELADAIVYALSRPPEVSINELVVRPTGQVEPS
jgi:clavulanate-9-aldehyde reducatase